MKFRYLIYCSSIFFLSISVVSNCPNACSGHGQCSTMGNGYICKCATGYFLGDCSKKICPKGKAWADIARSNDIAHNTVECSNQGTCDYNTGICHCEKGYTGKACDRMHCPNDCSGHGECRSMKYHASQNELGTGLPTTYNVWDANMIYGCYCHKGYYGPSCSLRSCPQGDDPLTGSALQPVQYLQYNAKQQIQCAANSGHFTLTFKGETTSAIYWNDNALACKKKINALSTLETIDVRYSINNITACAAGEGNFIEIEFLQDFGPQPLFLGESSDLEQTNVGDQVILEITNVQIGTKENIDCSGRGLCNTLTGSCGCFDGYSSSDGYGNPGTRGDCGYPLNAISACPGSPLVCSGHGMCSGDPTYRCDCFNGWEGGDCSLLSCPLGEAWFDLATDTNTAHNDVVCSNAGQCNQLTGECTCLDGFEGAACERMSCPGVDSPCSGHGICLTMAQLAQKSLRKDFTSIFSYGIDPNNVQTWDAAKIQGCYCDDGYSGHDCSIKQCPYGDDPRTPNQVNAIQTIRCQVVTTTTFRLSFRGYSTASISSSISAADLEAVLEELPSMGDVSVIYSSALTACTTSTPLNTISIIFNELSGEVPPVIVSYDVPSAITSFSIYNDGTNGSQKATSEYVVCSNNGVCDYKTGLCQCYEGMGHAIKAPMVYTIENCNHILTESL